MKSRVESRLIKESSIVGIKYALIPVIVQPAQLLESIFKGVKPFSIFPEEKLILVHAAILPEMLSMETSEFWDDPCSQTAAYGQLVQIEGEPFPRKTYAWVDEWDEEWTIVFGHDVIGERAIIRGKNKNVIGIDTGASYGGRLSALRWPEKEIVSVSARYVYPEHVKDFSPQEPGTIFRYSWNEVLKFEHKNTDTIHYLHGKRKTPEMSIPRSIKMSE